LNLLEIKKITQAISDTFAPNFVYHSGTRIQIKTYDRLMI